MESDSSIKFNIKTLFTFLVLGFALFAGCKNSSSGSNPVTTNQDPQATQDAGTSIGGAFAINNGGILDQVADLLNTPTSTGILSKSNPAGPNDISTATYTYDSTTGWWTVYIDRTRSGILPGIWSTHFTRTYQHQFLDQFGHFQKKYITNLDTAYSVNHKIIAGTGEFNTPWLAHQLKALSCVWTGTGTNTSTVTINTTTPYTRAAIDTIFGAGGGVRTLDHSITVNFINVTGPRGSGFQWWLKTSGTLTGHYHALVTFEKGTTYTEHTIDRDFTVTLGGPKLIIVVGDVTYQADPNTGQI